MNSLSNKNQDVDMIKRDKRDTKNMIGGRGVDKVLKFIEPVRRVERGRRSASKARLQRAQSKIRRNFISPCGVHREFHGISYSLLCV